MTDEPKVSELGSDAKIKDKMYYILFSVILFAYLMWSWIGVQTPGSKQMVEYYAVLGVFAISFILFDNAAGKKFGYVDSVTVEKTPITFKYIAIISFAAAILFAARIVLLQSAFIPYPQFAVFDSALPNAILSGVCGWIENLFFFAFMFPTLVTILSRHLLKQFYIALVASIILISLIFMGFHVFVYGASEAAMLNTFIFALICSTTTALLRTVFVADMLHITNNVVATIINARVALAFF